jgi:carbon-monoxide dehydrogenase small subunit
MKQIIELTINGERRECVVEPATRLRDAIGLTGTKEGCGNGECGACTVIVDGRAVNSCLMLALEAVDSEIETIEGLAKAGKLHPLQRAFMECGGLQCGICTPGMIMAAKSLLDENPTPTRDEIRFHLAGNLCRCTGYHKIVEAVEQAVTMMQATPAD